MNLRNAAIITLTNGFGMLNGIYHSDTELEKEYERTNPQIVLAREYKTNMKESKNTFKEFKKEYRKIQKQKEEKNLKTINEIAEKYYDAKKQYEIEKNRFEAYKETKEYIQAKNKTKKQYDIIVPSMAAMSLVFMLGMSKGRKKEES